MYSSACVHFFMGVCASVQGRVFNSLMCSGVYAFSCPYISLKYTPRVMWSLVRLCHVCTSLPTRSLGHVPISLSSRKCACVYNMRSLVNLFGSPLSRSALIVASIFLVSVHMFLCCCISPFSPPPSLAPPLSSLPTLSLSPPPSPRLSVRGLRQVSIVRSELLSWYDKNRRMLPWRGDPPPWTRQVFLYLHAYMLTAYMLTLGW